MRPTPLRFALAAVALAVLAGSAPAQFGFAPKAKIDKVRIGFRPTSGGERDAGARPDDVLKVGMWAPVSVGVEFDKMKGYKKGILLEVTTVDCDELRTISRFPIIPETAADPDSDEYKSERGPGMRKEPSELTNTAYVKVPSDSAEVRLRLVQEDDPEKALSDTEVRFRTGARGTNKYVILTLGGKLPGLDFARKELYGQRVEQAHLDIVEEMPDQWFGYEGADLVVLPTGGPTPEFISRLFNSSDPTVGRKRRALFEWVRRGGKLVVSAGDRAAEVAASPEFSGYTDKGSGQWTPGPLPVLVSPTPKVNGISWDKALTPATPLSWHEVKYTARALDDEMKKRAGAVVSPAVFADDKLPKTLPPALFAVAALKDNPLKTPHTVLLKSKAQRAGEEAAAAGPLVVQAPFGLGRVTLVAFDLDRSPFADESNRIARTEFWEWLVAEAGDREAAKVPTELQRAANPWENQPVQPGRRGQVNPQPNYSADRNTEDGIVAALRGSVDNYDEVPVISFGWVALFILGYTLLIGPIEYILLKKLLGKLELTWVTFPIIVLSVSGAAYLTAYAVKGKDLRMNKVDVVDIDLRTDPARPRVYGRTWFTIFSPRIDSYTVGVEPKANWATQRDDKGYTPVTTVDGFGIAKPSGVTAGSRGYTYEIDPRGDNSPQANGVSGVPIQVWSTKAFAANWSGVADPTAPPVAADLKMLPEGGRVAGQVKYNLTLKDVDQAYLAYRGKVYQFEKAVVPGVPVTLAVDWNKPELDTVFQNDPKFIYREQSDEDFGWGGRNRNQQKTAATADAKNPLNLWGLLFHEKATVRGNIFQNGTLRPLDQSWRLDDANTGEVILMFKLKRASKQEANALMTDTDSPSPTRVWLHGLPGRGTDKWAVDGIVQQDTYVRMYLPVKPAGGR